MRLRTRLFLLVAGTVVPLVVLTAVLGALLVDHQREIYRLSAIDRNRSFMSAVDAELRGHMTSLKSLAAARSLEAMDLPRFRELAARVLPSQPGWQNIVLTAADGRQLVNLRNPAGEALPGTIDVESMERAVKSRDWVVGSVKYRPLLDK
ncbi:MAG TPA: hypothetical protein VGK44_07430, partial [Casimicrobiaceae bacterium]